MRSFTKAFDLGANGTFSLLAMTGYGLVIALVSLAGWPSSSFAFSTGTFADSPTSPFVQAKNIAYYLSFFAWFTVSMLGGVRLWKTAVKRRTCWAFSGLFMLGGLVGLAPLAENVEIPVEIACGILVGVGMSGSLTLWVGLLGSRETPVDARCIIGGTLIGGLLYFMIAWMSERVVCAIAVFAVAPGSSLLLVYCTRRVWPDREVSVTRTGIDGDTVSLYGGSIEFPLGRVQRTANLKNGILSLLTPCLVIGAIGSVMQTARLLQASRGSSELLLGNINSLSLVISAVLLFVYFERSCYRVDMNIFYKICAPFIGVVALGLPLFGLGYGYAFSFMLYTIFSIASMMGILACTQVARHYRLPSVTLYALVFAIIYMMRHMPVLVAGVGGAILRGEALARFTEDAPLWCALASVSLMFCSYVISDRYRRTQETAQIYSWESRIDPSIYRSVKTAEEAVADFGRKRGLTNREVEILVLLTKGRNTPTISLQLGISQNTVRFHCKNLYDKLGVHSRQELIEYVEIQIGIGQQDDGTEGDASLEHETRARVD